MTPAAPAPPGPSTSPVPPPRPSGAIAGPPAPSREREDLDIHSVILKGAGALNFPSLEKIASANNLYKPDAEAFLALVRSFPPPSTPCGSIGA